MSQFNDAHAAVVFVHGTYSYHEDEERRGGNGDGESQTDRWWQRNSTFCRGLQEAIRKFKGDAVCVPVGSEFVHVKPWWYRLFSWLLRRVARQVDRHGRPETVFHWSGENSETARRAAANLLLDHLMQLGRPFHVVGHSHGGSVIWEALRLARRRKKYKCIRDQLKTWTTVGTPYLHFQVRWQPLLYAVLPFSATLWLSYFHFLPWLKDFWRQATLGANLGAAFAFLGVTLIPVLLVSLTLRAFWLLYRYRHAKTSTSLHGVWKTREFYNLTSGLIAIALASVVSCVVGLKFIPTDLFDWEFWSLHGLRSLAVSGWSVLIAWLISYYLWNILHVLFRWLELATWRRSVDKQTWQVFGQRGLCLAVMPHDEGITGLTAAARGLEGNLLPRARIPGREFSESYWHITRPERESNNQSFVWWLARNGLLPLAIVKDWVLQPLYNGVYAGYLDDFFRQQLRRRALGADITPLTVRGVSDHPYPDHREVCCSREVCDEIIASITEKAPKFLESIRNDLLLDQPAALNLERVLKDAATGDAGATSILIHNEYFNSKNLAKDIAAFIANGRKPDRLPPVEDLNKRPKGTPPRPSQFLLRLVWTATSIALSMIPVAILYVLGLITAYPHSLEFFLREWANNEDLARIVLHRETLDNKVIWANSRKHFEAPRSVRWLLAQELANRCDGISWMQRNVPSGLRSVFAAKMAQRRLELGLEDSDYLRLAASEAGDDEYAHRLLARCLIAGRNKERPALASLLDVPPQKAAEHMKWARQRFYWNALDDSYAEFVGDDKHKFLKWCSMGDCPHQIIRRISYCIIVQHSDVDAPSRGHLHQMLLVAIEKYVEEQSKKGRAGQVPERIKLIVAVANRWPSDLRCSICRRALDLCDLLDENGFLHAAIEARIHIAMSLDVAGESAQALSILEAIREQMPTLASPNRVDGPLAAAYTAMGYYSIASGILDLQRDPEDQLDFSTQLLLRKINKQSEDSTDLQETLGSLTLKY